MIAEDSGPLRCKRGSGHELPRRAQATATSVPPIAAARAHVWATEILGRYCTAWLGSASDIPLNFIAKRACGHATPTNGLKRPNWHFCSRSSWIFGRTRSDLADASLGQTKTPDQIEGHGKLSLAELEIALSSITAQPRCRLPKPEILARQLRLGRVTVCPVRDSPRGDAIGFGAVKLSRAFSGAAACAENPAAWHDCRPSPHLRQYC